MMTALLVTSFKSVVLCNTDKHMFWLLQRTGIMWREVSRSEQWVQLRSAWVLIQPQQLVSESMFTHREMIASRKNMNWKLTTILQRFEIRFSRNSDDFLLTLIAELSRPPDVSSRSFRTSVFDTGCSQLTFLSYNGCSENPLKIFTNIRFFRWSFRTPIFFLLRTSDILS